MLMSKQQPRVTYRNHAQQDKACCRCLVSTVIRVDQRIDRGRGEAESCCKESNNLRIHPIVSQLVRHAGRHQCLGGAVYLTAT